MRIFSKNKSDSNNQGNVRSFSVGNVEKTTYKKQAIIEDDNDFLKPPPSMNAAISEKKRSSSLMLTQVYIFLRHHNFIYNTTPRQEGYPRIELVNL